jgi:hypothetical protein
MHDPRISLINLLAALAWLLVAPTLAASWLLDQVALTGVGVCSALVGSTLIVLRDNNRSRGLARVLAGIGPADHDADLRSIR